MTARRVALLVGLAFALRCALFGNPVIHVDEQFYLLVGDRLLGGALPYVDIWDRKPVGLFLVYAAIRALGGDGIVAYQVVATLAAAVTALIAARIADRLVDRGAALAGVVYLLWLMICDGAGGQAPVFYDLPVAAAAAIVVDSVMRPGTTRPGWRGAAAMASIGIAIQLKYTVALEGALFGLALLYCLRRDGASWARVAVQATLWAAIALVPTAAAYGYYAAIGQGDAFVFANFVSIFARGEDGSDGARSVQLLGAVAALLPLAIPAVFGLRSVLREGGERRIAALFLIAWLVVATAAILLVGTFRLQYFLPLLLPLGIAAATGLRGLRPAGLVLAIGLVGGALVARDHVQRRGTARQVATLVDRIGQRPAGCLFVFGSEPILYHFTRSCLPSRFLFRSHLAQRREAGAIGVDQLAELRRVLATHPGVIVVRDSKGNADPRVEAQLRSTLAREYRLAGEVQVGALPHAVYRLRGVPQSRIGQPLAVASRRSAAPGLTATGSSAHSSVARSDTSSE